VQGAAGGEGCALLGAWGVRGAGGGGGHRGGRARGRRGGLGPRETSGWGGRFLLGRVRGCGRGVLGKGVGSQGGSGGGGRGGGSGWGALRQGGGVGRTA